jgi:histidinol-phosphate aminotransferase
MAVSRRAFLASVGAGGAGALVLPSISWRGYESLHARQGLQGMDARRADRLLAAKPGMIRIDSNENPNGPGQRVLDVIRGSLGQSNRYPVKSEDDLIDAVCKRHGVKPENVILGCGSGELLRAAVRAFTRGDRALVSPQPTFEAPATFAKFINVPVVAPPVDALLRLDLDAMAELGKGAGLVYFCNPNNPTATVHGKTAVDGYVEYAGRLSPGTTFLIDEAYHEYVADPSYATSVPLALANPRVVVTRTCSKVFGMAGLRVGYAIGQPATVAAMAPWLLGSNVNQLALVAAHTAIADDSHIAQEQGLNQQAREATRKFFEKAGYKVGACEANFMMVDIRRDVKAFKAACIAQGVAVGRPFPPLTTHLRVSIGTMAEMRKAFAVFQRALA